MSGPFSALDGLIEVRVLQQVSVAAGRRVSNPSYLPDCRVRLTRAALLVFFNSFKVVLLEVDKEQTSAIDHGKLMGVQKAG